MIRVYADDDLIYDSRIEADALLGLTVTQGLNKGGTANIILPPGHAAYNRFVSYRTIVTIYKDDALRLRGRAIHPADDFYRRRTILCEGELCFFRDVVMQPYVYQTDPAAIFADVVNAYNLRVETGKRFIVGTVTVTDPNDYIRLESAEAEQISATLDKLVARCGGYFVFTTNDAGKRVINWLADLGMRSTQSIELGQNLMDFTRTDGDTAPVTRLYPYGAKTENTDERVTIESVNGGIDYIQDDDAVALRGVIEGVMYWDDVTQPTNLLTKAQHYLSTAKNVVTSLQLTAVDLSNMDKDIDSFDVGDLVRVRSKPHGVDADFLLTERTWDLLLQQSDTISLGKEVRTLTGSDVLADNQTMGELHKVERNIKSDYTLNIKKAVEETKTSLTSLIQQTENAIKMEVSEQYATNGDLERAVSTSMTQLADSFNFQFETLQKIVDDNNTDTLDRFETIEKYIRFEDGNIILGESGNAITLRIENDRIAFFDNGVEVAYISDSKLYITQAEILTDLQLGKFAYTPRNNGNLSLLWKG